MHTHSRLMTVAGTLLAAIALATVVSAGELPEATTNALASSTFVYIASMRKDGHFGKPAEIWFLWHNGAVYVGTPPTSWRARRIKAGRPQAHIAVGKPDGPSFQATGAIVKEPDVLPVLFDTYAKKYREGWTHFEAKFRDGFKDGSRVLIKYTPKSS